ncbi:MAG: REP-associated tyrosine transposase [Verrucomicrobiota bacterium]|jgi:REP element-mobilizing transposase RayT
MQSNFPRRPLRLDRLFTIPVYFVTFCTYRRRPVLAHPAVHLAFQDFASRAVTEHDTAVGRYVMMPDHLHLFVRGGEHFRLAEWIKLLKQSLGKAIATKNNQRIWQEGFFDHVLRGDESMTQKWDYIRENPVRAGLVTDAEEWPYQGEMAIIDRA